jgi:hypothetical protein
MTKVGREPLHAYRTGLSYRGNSDDGFKEALTMMAGDRNLYRVRRVVIRYPPLDVTILPHQYAHISRI